MFACEILYLEVRLEWIDFLEGSFASESLFMCWLYGRALLMRMCFLWEFIYTTAYKEALFLYGSFSSENEYVNPYVQKRYI